MRRYPGTSPFEEIWFIEVALDANTHLWVRYTITDGPAHQRLAVWAVQLSRDGVQAHREEWPLRELGVGWFSAPGCYLDAERASGRAGTLSWDLRLEPGPRTVELVPRLLEPLLRRGRTYESVCSDLTVAGTVNGKEIEGHGVLGHIFGPKSRLVRWAWCHGLFGPPDHPDAIFELLSAQLDLGALVTPPLTGAALWVGDQLYSFSSLRNLVGIEAHHGVDRFSFCAEQDGVTLYGEAELTGPLALLEYRGPDDHPTTARNGPFCPLRLYLERPGQPVLKLRSPRATLELAERGRIAAPHLVG